MATVVMAVIATVVMAVMVTVVTTVAGVVVVTTFIQERLHVFSIQKLAVLATNSSESSLHRVIGSIPEPALQALDVALQGQLSFDDGEKGAVLVTRQVSAFASFTRGTLQSGSLEVIVLTGEQHWLEFSEGEAGRVDIGVPELNELSALSFAAVVRIVIVKEVVDLISGDASISVLVDASKSVRRCETAYGAQGLAEALDLAFTLTHGNE